MLKVVTAAQMREIDRVTIHERGVPGIELMERAGEAVAREALERFEPLSAVIVAGKGNNGGDGYVAARYLAQAGVPTLLIALAEPESLQGEALEAWRRLEQLASPLIELIRRPAPDEITRLIRDRADVVIDAILGTGITGAVGGNLGEAIEAINAARVPVLAVDIPSGLPGDGQPPAGPCVRAAVTVTIGLPKVGLVIDPGRALSGIVTVADIGFPSDLLESEAFDIGVPGMDDARAWLPPRPAHGHKGTFGKALILGGSEGMTGAAVLAARAAARSGAGLIYVAYPRALGPIFESLLIEPVKLPLPKSADNSEPWFIEADVDFVLAEAAKVDAIALGPGLGRRDTTREFVRRAIAGVQAPMVIDADALNLLAGNLDWLNTRPGPTILTPHPAEAARLLDCTVDQIESNRLEACRELARARNVTVVLKGSRTIVTSPDGARTINPTGNSGLAKGGSGDVLTGLIAGLLAQGADAPTAARLGVFLHGVAADRAARNRSVRAIIPSDVIESFGEAYAVIERGEPA